MKPPHRPLLLLLLLGVFGSLQHTCLASEQQRIVLHDPSHSLLRLRSAQHKGHSVSPAAATGALCAATGLVPPVALDRAAAADVEAVVQPVLGQAQPKAVLLLHLAGMSPGEASA